MKSFFLFLVLFGFSSLSISSNNSNFKIYYLNKDSLVYKSKIDGFINQFESKNPEIIPKIVNIQIDFNAKNSLSYTEMQLDNCQIYINFRKNKPVILNNLNDDLKFTLFHEIGHCVLGNKNFYDDFKWKNLKKNEVNSLNLLISKINKFAKEDIECIDCFAEDFKYAPPIAVYHEIFSDVFSIFVMNQLFNEKNNIDKILKYRKNEFLKSPKNNFYALSFLSAEDLYNLKSFDDVLLSSQKCFYLYLKFIKKYY